MIKRQVSTKESMENLDSEMDSAMIPVEYEMLRIFEEQEEEVLINLNKVQTLQAIYGITRYPQSRTPLLTADTILDFARWTGETARRLSAYTEQTMRRAWCAGLRLLGEDCKPWMAQDLYVQAAIDILTPLNYRITDNSKRQIEDLVRDSLDRRQSIEEFKAEVTKLFDSWKAYRPKGVSVFNVTFPWNVALLESYKSRGIEYKMWVNQEMIGVTAGELRDTHRAAGGQIKRMHEKFEVGRAKLAYPGDLSQISINPEEIFGCRCLLRPVLDPEGDDF